MANSSTVSSGDLATATQYNNLRSDVIDTSTGHVHDGTNGRGDAQTILQVAGSPLVVENSTDATSNQVLLLRGDNATRATNDEIYISFHLDDAAGNTTEFGRMTVKATDVTNTSEDGQIEFDVMKAGTLTNVWTLTSSSGAAMSYDLNVDSVTFGTGTAATDITLTFDAESADGVITWMEDEDYFQFSDDILMNSTERINFYDTAIYIYSSTDGQLDLVADTEIQIAATTIDINGAVALDGAITGATNITLSGELDAATLDISGNADIDGTTNLDAVDIDGAVQIDATFTSGVDGQGYDTKFFGDTSGAYILWDTSADKLLTAGGAVVDIVKDKLLIGGTAVTTTAAELNVLDAVTAGTVTASLGVVVDSNKDIGTFRNITLSGELDAGSLDVSGNADIDGTLEADAITIGGTNVVTGSLITTLGTISAGVWEGTDVGVTHGGTGASSLTDGGVLLGSGTGAVTAMAVLADSEMIVGDGTTDPVAESGATLRTSIGVGTGNNVEFAAITGTTIDATTDFTIGDTVVTNGVITDSSGLALAANVTVTGNVLPNADDTYDLGSASYAWQDLFLEGDITLSDAGTVATSAGALTITSAAAATWSTAAGILTIDGDDGVVLQTGGSGNVVVKEILDVETYMAIGSGDGGLGPFNSKYTLNVDRNHTVTAGGAGIKLVGEITVNGGTTQDVAHGIFGGGGSALTITSGNTHTAMSTLLLYEPVITETSGDVTTASTLHIKDAPTEGDNNYALLVDSGLARFDSGIVIGNVTSTTTQTIDDASNGSDTATLYIGNNTIDVTAPSDAILKENIEDSTLDSLSILDQLKLRDFNWKSDHPNYGSNTETQFGMVAQEVEEVLPHLVRQDGDGIRNVQYNNMIPYLVKAIQELNQELQEIKGGS